MSILQLIRIKEKQLINSPGNLYLVHTVNPQPWLESRDRIQKGFSQEEMTSLMQREANVLYSSLKLNTTHSSNRNSMSGWQWGEWKNSTRFFYCMENKGSLLIFLYSIIAFFLKSLFLRFKLCFCVFELKDFLLNHYISRLYSMQ